MDTHQENSKSPERQMYSRMSMTSLRQLLVHAMREAEPEILAQALHNYKQTIQVTNDDDLVHKAEVQHLIMQICANLGEQRRANDIATLKKTLQDVRERESEFKSQRKDVLRRLRMEIAESERCLQMYRIHSKRRRKLEEKELVLTRDTLREIQAMNNPPRHVHKLLQATLLLFGEDEISTQNWTYCRKMFGLSSPYRKKFWCGFDTVTSCHTEMIARADEIMGVITKESVIHSSTCATSVYYYATALIGIFKKEKSDEKVIPANAERQRQILQRPLTPRTFADWKRYSKDDAFMFKPKNGTIVEPLI